MSSASQSALPSDTLATAAHRAAFVTGLPGDLSLAKHAEDDAPLLRQLEKRATILPTEAAPVLRSAALTHS